MPYAGKTMMGRDVCEIVQWTKLDDGTRPLAQRRTEALAVLGGESAFSVGAYHDNPVLTSGRFAIREDLRSVIVEEPWRMEGKTVAETLLDIAKEARAEAAKVAGHSSDSPTFTSRDCGLGQINIPWRLVGTETETNLRTESKDPLIYKPVARKNIQAVAALYTSPWIFPSGHRGWREWQAWVAALTGWCWYPEFYCWHRDANGQPVGPWVPTGRFLQKAIRAVVNHDLLIAKKWTDPRKAVEAGERLAEIYGVTKGELAYDAKKFVYWKYPTAPTSPPADPWAAYPKRNDGRSPLSVMVEKGTELHPELAP